MKYKIIILLLIIPSITFAQNTPATFWSNRCDYNTNGMGKSLGLKIKLSYPCSWTQQDGDRPHVVKKFSYGLNKGMLVMEALTVSQLQATPSKSEVAQMLTPSSLKELWGNVGTFISSRKVKIDGLDCGEIIFKVKKESPVATIYFYNIQYYIFLKDKMINLSFAAGGLSEADAKTLYTNYKVLFQGLATSTIFLSKWE